MYNTDLLGGSSTLSAITENGDRYDVNSLNISDLSENPKLLSVTINENTDIPFVNINDEQSSTTSTYSSNKIDTLLNNVDMNGVVLDGDNNIISTTNVNSLILKCDSFNYNYDWKENVELPYNFYNGKAIEYNNELHIMGCEDGSDCNTSHYKWNGSEWVEDIVLPNTIFDAVLYDDTIYIAVEDHKLYKYTGTSWELVSENAPYYYYGGTNLLVINNELYCIYCSNIESVWNYYSLSKFDDNTWNTLDNSEMDGTSYASFVYNNEIYLLLYSYTKGNYFKWCNNTWVELENVPFGIRNHNSYVVYDNEIYKFGSDYYYKYNGEEWILFNDMPYEFSQGSAVVYNNEIHILGGENNYTKHYSYEKTNIPDLSNAKLTGINISDNQVIPIESSGKIDDNNISTTSTYSSDKINNLLSENKSFPAITEDNKNLTIESLNLKNEFKWVEDIEILNSLYDGSAFVCNGGTAFIYNDEIHIANGVKHYKYNSIDKIWTEDVNFPEEIDGKSLVVYNNIIYLLGGYEVDPNDKFNEIPQDYYYIFDNNENVWSLANDYLPYCFNRGISIVYNDELYILGGLIGEGFDAQASNNFAKYNENDGWLELDLMPIYVDQNCRAIVYNNEIHLFCEQEHYKFNGTEWTQLDNLPYSDVFGTTIVVYNNKIHMLGNTTYRKSHYEYDGSTWIRLEDLPYEFELGSSVVYNDEIHIIGGYKHSKYHYKYAIKNNLKSFTIDDEDVSLVTINDGISSDSTTYSSNKIEELLSETSGIDDNNASTTSTYSSSKIEELLLSMQIKNYYIGTTPPPNEVGEDGDLYLIY